MMTPDDIDVWVGLDVGKSARHAHALDHDGNTLYDKPLKQDEKAIRTMLGKLSKHGRVLLVVDQPNTIGSLPLTVARNMGIAVAYLPGTAMRRTAQLLPGDAKTDRRDAHVIAWAALKLPETLRDAGPDDETLAALKLLAGHDEDLAHESTRHVNRQRSLLLQTHPAFERALKGERITRDATLALLERYGGPMGVKRAGIEDVKDWAKSNGLRAGRIIDHVIEWAEHNGWRIPEHFKSDWSVDLECNADKKDDQFKPYGATPGHGIEWARLITQWALSSFANLDGAQPYVDAAEHLFARAVADAWNADGTVGLAYTTDWNGKPVVTDRMHWTLAESLNTSATLYAATGEEMYANWYATFAQYVDEHVIDHESGSWFHQLDKNNHVIGTVWPGKSDLYHAFQSTLIPFLDPAVSIATAVKNAA